MNTPRTLLCFATLVALLGAAAAPAADVAPQAREILARAQKSLITVSALSKLDMGGSGLPARLGALGEPQESQLRRAGDRRLRPDGGVLFRLEPDGKAGGGHQDQDGRGRRRLKAKTELSRIQMRLEDGTEVPARLVLKDKELDLAFIVPDPKEGDKVPQFTPVKLSAGAAVKELDDVVAISRHGKDLGYQPIVTRGPGHLGDHEAAHACTISRRRPGPVRRSFCRTAGCWA